MAEDLIDILGDLDEEQFQSFKWYLKAVKWNDISPIQVNQLSKAERLQTVDLMVQKYEEPGALEVTTIVLKKISRNDLMKKVQALMKTLGGPDQADPPGPGPVSDPASDKLLSIRTEFVQRVSEPVLRKLLDKLLESRVLTDNELEKAGSGDRSDKARVVIDMVRKKGTRSSSALISALCEIDPCLSEVLQLM
nr:caspase recruitment domain-containing protein 18 [Parambassis ranga]